MTGFCIVSSDSDYTRLATRIREKGFFTMGIGRKVTPRAFVNACEVFVYTENLKSGPSVADTETPSEATRPGESSIADLLPMLKAAFGMAMQDDGWAFLSSLGNTLRQLDPSFDVRTYGHRQLSSLIKDSAAFEVKEVKTPQGPTHIYVNLKD